MARIRNLSHRTKEPDPFLFGEVEAILAASNGQIENLFRFAFFTGLRTGVLIALEWGDIDLDKQIAHIRRAVVTGQEKRPKTASGERDISLLPPTLDALQVHPSEFMGQISGRRSERSSSTTRRNPRSVRPHGCLTRLG